MTSPDLFQMAMGSFKTLISQENKQRGMSWAREWLLDLGVEEHNVITLFEFSCSWKIHFIAVLKYVRGVAEEYRL